MQTTGWGKIDLTLPTKHVPMDEVLQVLGSAPDLLQGAPLIQSPVLLLHSMDDWLSDYDEVAKLARRLSKTVHLVTLRHLNHWVQFDIPPKKLANLIETFAVDDNKQPDNSILSERYRQGREEARHWAAVVLRIFIGYVTLASGAVAATTRLGGAENATPSSLHLSLFALFTASYLILLSAYFC
jgi:hypothetical protein